LAKKSDPMGIDFADFQQVFAWTILHGYVIIFLVMCVEGPIVTAAAGFASALGYFNPLAIFILSILGDIVPDVIYYIIGYSSRNAFVERFSGYFGLSKGRVGRLETALQKHFTKTMIAMKFTPLVPTYGFMLVGYLRLSFRKFLILCLAVTIPKSLVFLLLGYFFGQLYNINTYLHYLIILFPLSVVVAIAIYFGHKKISAVIAQRVGEIK
jgi:membrane protein DedA with SNARE-associated domain